MNFKIFIVLKKEILIFLKKFVQKLQKVHEFEKMRMIFIEVHEFEKNDNFLKKFHGF